MQLCLRFILGVRLTIQRLNPHNYLSPQSTSPHTITISSLPDPGRSLALAKGLMTDQGVVVGEHQIQLRRRHGAGVVCRSHVSQQPTQGTANRLLCSCYRLQACQWSPFQLSSNMVIMVRCPVRRCKENYLVCLIELLGHKQQQQKGISQPRLKHS